MKIDAIGFNQKLIGLVDNWNSDVPQPVSFDSWLGEQISTTNNQLIKADVSLQELASGKTENLHKTMLDLEQAKLSLQFMQQVRNRLMAAYQDLLREQI